MIPPPSYPEAPWLELQFDGDGKVIKRTGLRIVGAPQLPITYEYDGQNRLVKKNFGEPIKGQYDYVTTYSYDTAGRPLEAVSKSFGRGSESESSKEVFSHAPENNYSERAEYWGEALRYKYGYVRDDRGRVVELRRLSEMIQGRTSLKYIGKMIFSRDASGNITRVESYDNEGKLEGVETDDYVFDAGGNWIKRTTWRAGVSDGKLSNPTKDDVVYRVITYY